MSKPNRQHRAVPSAGPDPGGPGNDAAPAAGGGPATDVLISGLDSPMKLTLTPGRNLVISQSKAGPMTTESRTLTQQPETGETGGEQHTGFVAIYGRSGERICVLLSGLPTSVTSTVVDGLTVYIQIGARDLVVPGPVPGTEVPNPNPSSPILASVLAMKLPCPCDELRSGFSISPADHEALMNGRRLTLKNEADQRATLRLLTKLPNFTPAPVPGAPDAVQGSNPFGMVMRGRDLYMSDAAQNTVIRVETRSGQAATLLTFPKVPNPGGMPPAVDAVPDSIRLDGDDLLVPLLSGFPFTPGTAEVQAVSFDGGHSPLITGLTSAIDVLPVPRAGGGRSYLVLEFSRDQQANAPGRLLRYDRPTSPPETLLEGLVSPTNLAYDEIDGTLYISEVFAGNVRTLTLRDAATAPPEGECPAVRDQ